ncbi:MAG: nucleoside triphosphate pyrophosphohydrolase [Patescibacteria group bacterium]
MKKIFYNKIIRDNIPNRIRSAGADYSVCVLPKKKFEKELIRKVEEEAGGMQRAQTRRELIDEMADVIDVLEAIRLLKKISKREVAAARTCNQTKKGGFKKRLFLFWSSDSGYKINEKRHDKRRARAARQKT